MAYFSPRTLLTLGLLLTGGALAPCAHAQYTEVENNNSKSAANVLNLGTATSATLSGTSANSSDAERDYFRINTSPLDAGIYLNQIQLSNASAVIGSLRGLTQSNGTLDTTSDTAFQSSQVGGSATPLGTNRYYSFGGAGKTQSMYYRVSGAGATTGGSYTATFTSSVVTPTNLGSFPQGSLSFAAATGQATNTEAFVLDANYNVYVDTVPSSATNGYIASNDNPLSGGAGFSLQRSFSPGTYYLVVGISNVATNDTPAPDDSVKGNSVLDFDNVIATSNSQFTGNGTTARPTDFTVRDYTGTTYTSTGQQISSLYTLNFYRFQVDVAPEPGSLALTTLPLLVGAFLLHRRRTVR